MQNYPNDSKERKNAHTSIIIASIKSSSGLPKDSVVERVAVVVVVVAAAAAAGGGGMDFVC